MNDEADVATVAEQAPTRAPRPPAAAVLDRLVILVRLRPTRLGIEIRSFARCLEEEIFPALRGRGLRECSFSIEPGKGPCGVQFSDGAIPAPLPQLSRMVQFLREIGVRKVTCDVGLEREQISDVLETLWLLRRPLGGAKASRGARLLGRDRLCDALVSPAGLHMSCANAILSIGEGSLVIRCSYCQLVFSRVVAAYKKRMAHFRDHRAFFRAAPRYAIVISLAILLSHLGCSVFNLPRYAMLAVAVSISALSGFGTYVVFQTIGAEEYDKEHQAKKLQERHYSLERLYRKIQEDLDTAREIQRTLLPDPRAEPFPGKVRIAQSFVPEMEVGGDYFDVKRLDERRIGLLLADVAGHGLAAAFVTGLIKTTFEYARDAAESPAMFLGELNRLLERLTPPSSYAAVVYAIYDTSTRILTWANAGHGPPPILVSPGKHSVEFLAEPSGLLAGVAPGTLYDEATRRLEPGDKILICTDGITDAVNAAGERFGTQRLERVLHDNLTASADDLIERIVAAVAEHAGDAAQSDDRTMLAMGVLE